MRRKWLSTFLLLAMILEIMFTGNAIASQDVTKQNGLSNTLYKIANNQSLKVAYLGGSITDGYGASEEKYSYAVQSFDWLQEKYGTPNNITYTRIKKGVGGTGTTFGAYRVEEDFNLNDSSKVPDLTFIECAINDSYDGITYEQAAANMESIVRTLYVANAKMDIIILFTTDIYKFDYKNNKAWNEEEWPALKAHKAVADAYGIPTIYMGKKINELVFSENGDSVPSSSNGSVDTTNEIWGKYFPLVDKSDVSKGYDTVHPNDTGYAVYKDCIANYITSQIDDKTTPNEQNNVEVGTEKFGAYNNAYFAIPKLYSQLGNQWKMVDNKVYADGQNQIFKFKFNGTSILFHTTHSIGANTGYGDIVYYIDGIRYTKLIAGDGQAQMLNLASNLLNGEHDVTVITGENTIPSGKNFEVDKIGITGSNNRSGVLFDKDVKTTYLTVPDETVMDIDFAQKVDGHESNANLGSNWLDSTSYTSGDTTIKYNTADLYRRPAFYKYDISQFKNKDIIRAMFFGKAGNPNSFEYLFHDVPSDNLSYINEENYKRINVNTVKFASLWSERNINISDYISNDNINVNIDDYNMGLDITDYFKGEVSGDTNYATFMQIFNWGGYQQFYNPMIMVETADVNEKPIININKDKEIVLSGENVCVSVSSQSKLADVKYYVDGILYNENISIDNNVFSVNIQDLGYGEHEISAIGIDIYGNLSEESKTVISEVSSVYSSVPSVLINPRYGEDSDGNTTGSLNDINNIITVGTTDNTNIQRENWNNKKSTDDFSQIEPQYMLLSKVKLPKLAQGVSIKSVKILMHQPSNWQSQYIPMNSNYLYELNDVSTSITNWAQANEVQLKNGEAISDANYSCKKCLAYDNENFSKDKTGYTDDYNIYLDITDLVTNLPENQDDLSLKWVANKGALFSFRSEDGAKMINPVMFRFELVLPVSVKITSNIDFSPNKPYLLSAKVNGSNNAIVEFKVDGVSVGTTETLNKNGEYVLQVENGLSEGKHAVTAIVIDNDSLATGTDNQTVYANGYYSLIPVTYVNEYESEAFSYVTKDYEFGTNKDEIWGRKEGGSSLLACSKVNDAIVKTAYAYYQYDVDNIDSSRIDEAYIVYAAKTNDSQSYIKIDIDRIEPFAYLNTAEGKNDVISKNIIENIRSLIPMNEGNISTNEPDYDILNNIKKTTDAQVISKIDVTNYFKQLNTEGEKLALRFSKSTDSSAAISIQTTPYIYVTYKQDFIVDNGTSITVNLKPSDYTSTYDKIIVAVAKYNEKGKLININIKKDIPVNEAYTPIDVPKDNADYIKIFVWNNLNNMFPLAKVFEYR